MSQAPSAARVASYLPSALAAGYDIAVRVVALATFAGKKWNVWPQNRMGLGLAEAHFQAEPPSVPIHPLWFDPSPQGIAKSVDRKAHAILGSEDAEELVGRILGGLSIASRVGGGEAEAAAVALMKQDKQRLQPSSVFRNMFISHTQQKASDRGKTDRRHQKTRGQDVQIGDIVPNSDGAIQDIGTSDLANKPEIYLSENPMIMRWVQDQLDKWDTRDTNKQYAKAYFANVRSRQTANDLAKSLGVSPAAIKKAVKKAVEYLKFRLQKSPQVQHSIERLHGRTASARLADRWLTLQWLQRIAAHLDEG